MDTELLFKRLEESSPQTVYRADNATCAKLAVDAAKSGSHVAIAVRSRESLAAMRGLLTLFTPSLSVGKSEKSLYGRAEKEKANTPVWENPWIFLPPMLPKHTGREVWAERFAALYALTAGNAKGIVFTADNLLPYLPPKEFLQGKSLTIYKGEEISPELIAEQLTEWGYQRVPMAAHAGDMAKRGDIFDVLPPGYERPVRIEFFGDTVEEIRVFDFATQRSVGMMDSVTFLPVTPFGHGAVWNKAIQKRWQSMVKEQTLSSLACDSLIHALEQEDRHLMPGTVYENASVLEDWFPSGTICFMPGLADTKEMLEESLANWKSHFELQAKNSNLNQPAYLAVRSTEEANKAFAGKTCLRFEPMAIGMEQPEWELPERTYASFADLFGTSDSERPWQQLVAGIKRQLSEHRQVVLAFATERGRKKFLNLAEQDGLSLNFRYDGNSRGLFAVIAPYRQAADLLWAKCLVIGEELLQPKSEDSRRVVSQAFKGLDRYDGLQEGDLLVHRDYGVGRFGGLHRMSPGRGGVPNDYLLLEYADGAKLYLPVDRLSVVQKYKADGETPTLDRLGGTSWTAGREKAKKAAEKVAADLMKMYAWRKIAKGFSYSPVGEMYHEFAATFGFEETPDQTKAIQDVFDDMDKPSPMDRLICGDVGFGKTEVALRAAFRAVCDGRQVALLCPTTVLAEQHYLTFRSRLSGFPINVGLLSRFVSKAKQKETLEGVKKGQIDILIGTHRMLSKDVEIPNLGLLVLDEEQRFGVRHKEKMKEIKKNVDALTLTATPIPRTLQLSMSGIRELSILETAPAERKPVATAIVNRDRGVLREVMERELNREGQVFFVHNRVQTLAQSVDLVKELVPNARVGMAHGQMPEKELEDTMHKFWQGDLDVLVCTAIVEAGLDFPRANTLIVDQAQMFGLGQLYQLRGRVGRSDRQAYAVFVVNDAEHMPKLAKERLRIILETDYLGAGFEIAMEDLRLRGAGNILGEAQSGHLARVGLDLYLEMLEQAVANLKGEKTAIQAETEVNLGISAYIPDDYISDSHDRLKYYKMFTAAPDTAARNAVEMEIRDRFGSLPEALDNFLSVLELKAAAQKLGILRVDLMPEKISVTWPEGQNFVKPESIVKLVLAHQGSVKLRPPSTLEIVPDTTLPVAKRVQGARHLLSALAE